MIEALHVPTITAVRGISFGGGFEFVLNCDCIVAAEDKQDREPPEMIFHGR
jgi:enoyl-CoA hydratase/carnithine racemase